MPPAVLQFPSPGQTAHESIGDFFVQIWNFAADSPLPNGEYGVAPVLFEISDVLEFPNVTKSKLTAALTGPQFEHPGKMPSTADEFRVWKYQEDRHLLVMQALKNVKTAIYEALSTSVRATIDPVHKAAFLSAPDMIDLLRQKYWAPDATSLERATNALAQPLRNASLAAMTDYRANIMDRIQYLTKHSACPTEVIIYGHVKRAATAIITPGTTERLFYGEVIAFYHNEVKVALNRSVPELLDRMEAEATEMRHPDLAPPTVSPYHAHAAANAAAAAAAPASLPVMQALQAHAALAPGDIYCHTHGVSHNQAHTSATCIRRHPAHDPLVTAPTAQCPFGLKGTGRGSGREHERHVGDRSAGGRGRGRGN